jgi:hypothetical protein
MAIDSDEKFFAQLSEAELDEAEQIEKDVQAVFAEGWTKETAQTFVHAVMLIRKRKPGFLIPNMVDIALRQGIVGIVATVYGSKEAAQPKPKRTLNGKSKLSGKGV